ncbi:MAG: recombinase RecT [Glycomyces artemisiae]|uniref:Recombinase RecT n=1 Tax=Glycomyces artemisiae TaxID=1076443 RepID=A0A850C7R5_9ACTN|nr:recombinase RecT [Glycomyces artemisiae]
MSAQTVTSAVATRDNSTAALIEQYRGDIATVLPSHVKPEMWVRLAVGAVRRDKNLAAAAASDPASLMAAVMDAARQGLEPGTEQYYLTTRKVAGKQSVQGIRGYQGEIELIYRAGAVSSVIVEVVRAKDKFAYTPGRDERPLHEIDWDDEDRGELRLAYAYAIMRDGATSKVVVLNKRHIAEAKRNSSGASSPYSPWQKHEEAMWLKTAAHRLTKWVPTSAEYRREQLRAEAEVAAEVAAKPEPVHAAPPATDEAAATDITDTYIDGEVVDAPPPSGADFAPRADFDDEAWRAGESR